MWKSEKAKKKRQICHIQSKAIQVLFCCSDKGQTIVELLKKIAGVHPLQILTRKEEKKDEKEKEVS